MPITVHVSLNFYVLLSISAQHSLSRFLKLFQWRPADVTVAQGKKSLANATSCYFPTHYDWGFTDLGLGLSLETTRLDTLSTIDASGSEWILPG
ncbi:hypothetical protein FB45DRAFT_1034446 [Roridomyces roridus]|uniref:Uncharacterized protein n=1 Tax=Roridomyces roridus TaxID=1738132 RepID=A0AAD7BCA2_9AGAR|nr:hypothetical protein FB45DRAFT_1034446 [Roridomyces roridus]